MAPVSGHPASGMFRNAWLPLACLFLLTAVPLRAETLALPFDDAWQPDLQGAWTARLDSRGLLATQHPAVPSTKGSFALHRRTVHVPEDWQGSITLALYCSDDYAGTAPTPWPAGQTGRGFTGHRFKQVLVDTQLVWSADVADAPVSAGPPFISIPLPVNPGQTFQLGLLVYDTEASETVLHSDFYHGPAGETERAGAQDAFAFPTTVYWGDVQLVDAAGAPVPGRRPAEAMVLKRHETRWPMAPAAAGWSESTVRLAVDGAGLLPPEGFPLHFGVPFPPGKVRSLEGFRLQKPNGEALYCQKLPVALWPDESFRWVMVDLPVAPTLEAVDLVFKKDNAKAPRNAAVLDAKTQVLRAGDLVAAFGPGDPLHGVTVKSVPVLRSMTFAVTADGDRTPGTVQMIFTAAEGAAHSAITLLGSFEAKQHAYGNFSAQLATFERLPMLRLDFHFVNNTGAPLPLKSLEIALQLPAIPKDCAVNGTPMDVSRDFAHLSATPPALEGSPLDLEGPVYFTCDGLTAVVKDILARYPNRVTVQGDRLVLSLCSAEASPVVLNPGEQVSHEIWLGFGLQDPARFAAAVQRPPLLNNARYICRSGAVGPWADRLADDAPLRARLAAYDGKNWQAMGHALGLRDFTDQLHFSGPAAWAHNYTERLLGYWTAWCLTGDRAWYDRALACSNHLLDVAIVNGKTPEGDWAGALRGPGANHAGPPWPPGLRNTGFEQLYHWTEATQALQAEVDMADYVIRSKAGLNTTSARHHAAPLESILTAFRETGQADYQTAGTVRLAAINALLDRRRGVWLETYNDPTAPRTLPGPAGQLGRVLYAWYRETGDVEAAQSVVALADGFLEEADLTTLGLDAPGIAALLADAHDLTGDDAYAKAAETVRDAWNAAGAPVSVYDTLWLVTDAVLGGDAGATK